jgi:tetratricopeptide (TPR) repeat protein
VLRESKFASQLIAAVLLLFAIWTSSSFASNPEQPPEVEAQVDLEIDPNEAKVAPANRLAALPPQRDSQTATEVSGDSSDAVKLVKRIYAQTKTAKTAKDFSAIVQRCESALEPSLGLSVQHQEDVKGLMAWALSRRGQERVDLAVSLRAAGNQQQFNAVLNASLADFDQSLETDDSRWKTYFGRSIALANLDQTEKALSDLDKAIALNPKSKKARFNRAELLNWKGDANSIRAAIEDYDFVLTSSPKDVQAINGLAHAQLALGNIDQAIEHYTRVTELQPNNSVAWQARGEAYQSAENWKAASADFAKSMSIQKSAQGYLKAAWLFSTCPDPDFFEPITAMEYARQGKKIDPESVESLEVLAAASAANGEFADAVDLQKQAIKKSATVQANYQFDTDQMKVRLTSYEQEQPYLQDPQAK